jgi:hypothetical protein
MRTFEPWIGNRYESGGLNGIRLLVLGESHYGEPEDEGAGFTIGIIRMYAQDRRFRFFTVTQKLVSGQTGYVTNEQRREFWEHVAFYNFIQKFPGREPKIRPTEQMWADACDPYLRTIDELKPHLVIALGFDLGRRIPEVSGSTKCCRVQHPSSFRFDQGYWRGVVAKAINEVRLTS